MIILVDMDGVIADFESEFFARWRKRHPDNMRFTPETRKYFWLKDEIPESLHPDVFEILETKGFYRNMKPIAGAVEALREMDAAGHTVYLCTTPLARYANCVLEKFEWVDEHLGKDVRGGDWTDRIIFARDKTMIRGDILIDDKPDIDAQNAEWEHVLYDQPYNRSVPERRRLTWSNWKNVIGSETQVATLPEINS